MLIGSSRPSEEDDNPPDHIIPAHALLEIVVDGGAQLFDHQTVSNCRVERFSLEERFERWSNSTPTTSLDSL